MTRKVALREIFLLILILIAGFLTLIAFAAKTDLDVNAESRSIYLLTMTLTGAIGFWILSRVKTNPQLASRVSTIFAIVEGIFLTSLLLTVDTFNETAAAFIFVFLSMSILFAILSSIVRAISNPNSNRKIRSEDVWLEALSTLTLAKFSPLNYNRARS